MNPVVLLTILDTTLRILERQEHIRRAYQSVRDDVATMVREGRNPTPAEWHLLEMRLKTAGDTLSSRADEARDLLGK